MHHSIGSRTPLEQRILLPFGFSSNILSVNPVFSLRNNRFSLLPVIKEEEINPKDEENELTDSFVKILALKENKKKVKVGSINKISEEEKSYESKVKLPPLVNINCMMNVNIKQSQPVWKTNFGKKLISGKEFKENNNLEKISENRDNSETKDESSKRKLNLKENQKNIKRDKSCFELKKLSIPKQSKIKPKKVLPTNKFFLKRASSLRKKQNIDNYNQADAKLSDNPVEKLEKNTSDFQNVSLESLTVSSFSENQHLLTNCVKSILERTSTEMHCEYCSETVSDVESFSLHNKKHKEEKQACLICNKVFYTGNDFVHHLLTHESVDKYSCQKCKKYFPTARKYQKHCSKFHFMPPCLLEPSQSDFFWMPKYECKRCSQVFDSEEAQTSHRKSHIRTDLMGAYLLSSKHLLC